MLGMIKYRWNLILHVNPIFVYIWLVDANDHTILSYSYVFSYQTDFKNLQSLEICGGGLTDAGVKNIKDLASLRLLNLSQNCNLTDKTLELASGIYCFSSLICVSAVALLNIIILLYLWY